MNAFVFKGTLAVFRPHLGRLLYMLLLVCGLGCALAQTPIVLGPQTSTFTSMVRGYYFVAPVDFTICRLYVEDDFSTQMQHVEVVRLNAVPPVYPATTNSFTSLFYQNNYVPNSPIVCNIPITAGQIIGVYGARGNTTNMQVSYGNAPWVTPIYGVNATLYYSGMQFPLNNQQMHDIWYANFSRLSRVTMYYDCVILADGLVSFEGEAIGEAAQLRWTLSQDARWSRFELERSREGEDFRRIAEVEGNLTGGEGSFVHLDSHPGEGNVYYRLRLISQDGESTYSHVVSLQFDQGPKLSVFPHPAPTSGFFLRLPHPTDEAIHVELQDMNGKCVWQQEFGSEGSLDRMMIAPTGLQPGIYLLKVVGEQVAQTTKVVLI